jgi:hypothetical protein
MTDYVDHSDMDLEEGVAAAPTAPDADMSQGGTDNSEANDVANPPATENPTTASVVDTSASVS